jgi:prepilin-type N-terminal cleavage/methylation domain-containing protein
MLKLKKLMNAKGFTLVELLIVIAVIGILAIAVLAALDPIEQLKKSRDTGRLADARELVGAYQRYAVSYRCFPDEHTVATNTCALIDLMPLRIVPTWAEWTKMEGAGEIKTTFKAKASIRNSELWSSRVDDAYAVCFNAESKSAKNGGLGTLSTMNPTTGVVTTVTGAGTCDTSYTPGTIDQDCMICVQ